MDKLDDTLASYLLANGVDTTDPDAESVAEKVRYDHSRNTWHVWRNWRWARDHTRSVYDLIFKRAVADVGHYSGGDQKALMALFDVSKKESVLKALSSRVGIAMRGDEWDADPNLLGVANGIVDLRTGALITDPHPEWLVTRASPVAYDPNAPVPPVFSRFMGEITGGDGDLMNYVLSVLGYSLFGSQREQKFWLWVGPGNNGKGTLAKVISYVLGEYADTPSAELYMKTKHGVANAAAPRAELVKLQGIRFTWMSEPQGGAFNDELVKAHTGDDPIQARPLYSNDFITFRPTHTLNFLTNQPPRVEDVGPSMRRRARVIKFEQDFSQRMDPSLEERMREEAAGILRVLVAFAVQYHTLGTLHEPEKVTRWSAEYIEENDPVSRFINERCYPAKDASVNASLLYREYELWCREQGEEPRTQMTFGTALTKTYRKVKRMSGITYLGVGLKGAMALAEEGIGD